MKQWMNWWKWSGLLSRQSADMWVFHTFFLSKNPKPLESILFIFSGGRTCCIAITWPKEGHMTRTWRWLYFENGKRAGFHESCLKQATKTLLICLLNKKKNKLIIFWTAWLRRFEKQFTLVSDIGVFGKFWVNSPRFDHFSLCIKAVLFLIPRSFLEAVNAKF